VSIAEGRLQHLRFQQMRADFSLDKGLLKTNQQLKLYGGSYQGTSQIDLTALEPTYNFDGSVAGLELGPALSDLTAVKSGLMGVLTTDVHLAGRGFAWELVQKTLSGHGHVKIADAQLTHLDLLPKFTRLLQNLEGLASFTMPNGWEQSSWRTMEADWRLQQGRIITDQLRLRREGVEALLSGSIGLDQTLEYRGTLFLPVKVGGRRGAPLLLRQDEAGRVMLPFRVQGPVNAPRLIIDDKAVAGQAKDELIDDLRKRLGGKIDEFLGPPPTPEHPSPESEMTAPETDERPPRPRGVGKILQDLLRR
jgi:hypothetical protein